MKRYFVLILLLTAFLFNARFVGASDLIILNEPRNIRDQAGGRYFPATGQARALWVNIKFAGQTGNFENGFNTALDPSINAITPGSTTDYYDRMSMNAYGFIGDVVNVTTQHPLLYYRDNGLNVNHINYEVLTTLDTTIDFSDYDNIRFRGAYDFVFEPDGKVDMIIMCYYSFEGYKTQLFANYDGFAVLQLAIPTNPNPGDDPNNNDIVTNDMTANGHAVWIDGYYSTDYTGVVPTSGLSLTTGNTGWTFTRSVVTHELTHYFFGAGHDHPHNTRFQAPHRASNSMASRELTGSWWGGPLNALEREHLGWISIENHYYEANPTSNPLTLQILNYEEYGDAHRIYNSDGTYYLLEYRAPSPIQTGMFGEGGLYIMHKRSPTYGAHYTVCADGYWDWETTEYVPINPNVYGTHYTDKLIKVAPNPVSGYSDLDPIYIQNYNHDYYWNSIEYAYHGDAGDAFRWGGNTALTPWTNPNTGPLYEVSMRILNYIPFERYTVEIRFHRGTKPTNLTVSGAPGGHPQLTWTAAFPCDQYRVYRRLEDASNWEYELIATLNTNQISYRDTEFEILQTGPGNPACPDDRMAYYRVTAVRLTNQYPNPPVTTESGPSNEAGIRICNDASQYSPTPQISAFQLLGNHPNPFNPTTTIAYQLPVAERTSLKIYNTAGQLVRTLVNEDKAAGSHEAIWDGRNEAGIEVSGGVYLYALEAGAFTATKRLVLIR